MSSAKWRPFCSWGNVSCIKGNEALQCKIGVGLVRHQAIIWTIIWNIVNRTLRNKLQWNSYQNTNLFIHENAFQNVVWEMVVILSRGRCVNKQTQDVPKIMQWFGVQFVLHREKDRDVMAPATENLTLDPKDLVLFAKRWISKIDTWYIYIYIYSYIWISQTDTWSIYIYIYILSMKWCLKDLDLWALYDAFGITNAPED